MSQEGSGEAINQLYLSTVQKYEAVKDEYDALRKRYSELAASHSTITTKLEQAQVSCYYTTTHSTLRVGGLSIYLVFPNLHFG